MRTISELLQDTRIEKGYTLDSIVKATKIKKSYLVAIENGKFQDLPSESYALGFVKNYASYLGIDRTKATALFRREFEANMANLPTFKSQDKRFSKNYFLTPRNFLFFAIILVILGYIAFQYSSYFFGPRLEVLGPKENAVVVNSIVEVSGNTDPYATVLINGEEAYVQLDGTFRKTLYLFQGKKQIVVTSKNRNGKETKKIINVNVR